MNIYLLGEKINTGGRRVNPGYGQRAYKDPQSYWRYAMSGALGGFWWYDTPEGKKLEDACWRKLRLIIGEIEIKSFNMLVPSAVVGSWSRTEANLAADCVVQECPRPSLLVCCGTRVAKAIYGAGTSGSYPTSPGVVELIGEKLWMTRIPHPSGRNNGIWYNAEVIERARRNFSSGLLLLRLGLSSPSEFKAEWQCLPWSPS